MSGEKGEDFKREGRSAVEEGRGGEGEEIKIEQEAGMGTRLKLGPIEGGRIGRGTDVDNWRRALE